MKQLIALHRQPGLDRTVRADANQDRVEPILKTRGPPEWVGWRLRRGPVDEAGPDPSPAGEVAGT